MRQRTLLELNGPTLGDSEVAARVEEFNKEAKVPLTSDLAVVRKWVFPVDFPRREYQFNVVMESLFTNVFVSLPTGLGKTFVAAVVLFNFYRWFPSGKLVFLAPTRPLVAQQIEACFKIMGIPQNDMAELTGHISPAKRKAMWESARVIFATGQTVLKDIQNDRCPVQKIVCLVLDEAHHATGNHAYAVTVKMLAETNSQFRILALSATPGNQLSTVQEVLNNLRIEKLIVKTAEDPDVKPYVNSTKVELMIVDAGEKIPKVKALLLKIMQPVMERLSTAKVMPYTSPENLRAFYILNTMKAFQQQSNPDSFMRVGDLGVLHSLVQAKERLEKYGLYSFHEFISKHFVTAEKISRSKLAVRSMTEFVLMIQIVEQYLAETDDISQHPKLKKLEEKLQHHFTQSDNSKTSRVIVFSEYRSSVEEIYKALKKYHPQIRAEKFIGQSSSGDGSNGKGLTQKQQLELIQAFKEGKINTIVATSIAEEGLDIGEVDLCVFFDYKQSALRNIQRMGRTGRKKAGQCVILVSKGQEQQAYERNNNKGSSMIQLLQKRCDGFPSKGPQLVFFKNSPRMFPSNFTPEVLLMKRSPSLIENEFIRPSKLKKRKESAFLTHSQELLLEEAIAPKNDEAILAEIKINCSVLDSMHPSRYNRVAHSRDSEILMTVLENIDKIEIESIIRGEDSSNDFTHSTVLDNLCLEKNIEIEPNCENGSNFTVIREIESPKLETDCSESFSSHYQIIPLGSKWLTPSSLEMACIENISKSMTNRSQKRSAARDIVCLLPSRTLRLLNYPNENSLHDQKVDDACSHSNVSVDPHEKPSVKKTLRKNLIFDESSSLSPNDEEENFSDVNLQEEERRQNNVHSQKEYNGSSKTCSDVDSPNVSVNPHEKPSVKKTLRKQLIFDESSSLSPNDEEENFSDVNLQEEKRRQNNVHSQKEYNGSPKTCSVVDSPVLVKRKRRREVLLSQSSHDENVTPKKLNIPGSSKSSLARCPHCLNPIFNSSHATACLSCSAFYHSICISIQNSEEFVCKECLSLALSSADEAVVSSPILPTCSQIQKPLKRKKILRKIAISSDDEEDDHMHTEEEQLPKSIVQKSITRNENSKTRRTDKKSRANIFIDCEAEEDLDVEILSQDVLSNQNMLGDQSSDEDDGSHLDRDLSGSFLSYGNSSQDYNTQNYGIYLRALNQSPMLPYRK